VCFLVKENPFLVWSYNSTKTPMIAEYLAIFLEQKKMGLIKRN